MAQGSSLLANGEDCSTFVRQAISFTTQGVGGEQRQQGVLVDLLQPKSENDARGSSKPVSMRVLHSDGFIRVWESTEVAKVHPVHKEPYSIQEVEFKVERSIFRGGTRQARQLRGEALVSKKVDVWNEMARSWKRAQVVSDEGAVTIEYEDNTAGELGEFDVWRLEGEDTDDGILREKEETLLEAVHVKCIVTYVPEKKLVQIYKQLRSDEMPTIKASKTVVWVEEHFDEGGRELTVIPLPHPLDGTHPVDAVMDADTWLRIAYTRASD